MSGPGYLTFSKQLKKEFRGLSKQFNRAVEQAVIAGWREAVAQTPVRTGYLASNWKVSTARRATWVPRSRLKEKKDKYGRVERVVNSPETPNFEFRLSRHKRIYLFNNTPYAKFVELGINPLTNNSAPPRPMLESGKKKIETVLRIKLSSL